MNSFSIKTQYPLLAFCNTQESQQRKENFKKKITESKCMENLISDHPTICLLDRIRNSREPLIFSTCNFYKDVSD